MFCKTSWGIVGIVLLLLENLLAIPVFPGAQGAGTDTRAAYGGPGDPVIIKVTNLNSSGAGSFYDAVTTDGPRVVVFEVSGVISLNSNLYITHPYLTIAGQTAPSPGIMLQNGGLSVAASDVLIQHIRIARGDDTDVGDCLVIWGERYNPVGETRNVVVDHCSFRWGTDQTVSLWSSNIYDVTISNCIIAEGLDDSIHGEPHSTGLLIGPQAHNIDLIRNYFAHFMGRAPCVSENSEIVMINNIVYNLGYKGIYTQPKQPDSPPASVGPYFSVINNLSLSGLDTRNDYPHVWVQGGTASGAKVFLSGNSYNGVIPQDQWNNNDTQIDVAFDPKAAVSPVPYSGITVLPTLEVEQYICDNVGARPKDREANDLRNITNLLDGTGVVIDKPEDVGGMPVLTNNYRVLTIPANPHDDDDNDGYSNLEEWLHVFSADLEDTILPPEAAVTTEKDIYYDYENVITVNLTSIEHNSSNWIAIFRSGASYVSSNVYAWSYIENSDSIDLNVNLPVNDYKIVAFSNDTYTVIAEDTFSVVEYMMPEISTERAVYSTDENVITVNVTNIEHNSNHWIAIFKSGTTHVSSNIYAWSYIEDSDSIDLNVNLPVNDYKIVAFSNDTYTVIVENDFRVENGILQFKNAFSVGSEDVSPVIIDIQLSPVQVETVTVDFAVSGGTASNGVDYSVSEGSLVFQPGMTNIAISVAITNDALIEGDETVELSLSNPSNSVGLLQSVHVFTILGDGDGDGMDDDWEILYFGNLTHDDAEDVDGDGLSNADEYLLNSNPANSDSDGDNQNDGDEVIAGTDLNDNTRFFCMQQLAVVSNTMPVVAWLSVTGRIYSVAVSTNSMLIWEDVVTNILGTGETIGYTNEPLSTKNSFYKIRVRIND